VTPRPAPLTRRRFLHAAGGAAGAAVLAPVFAACGTTPPRGPFGGPPAGIVNFANWSLYIDNAKGPKGVVYHPSLAAFTDDTGISVNYRQVIEDNEPFFQQVQRYLAAGEPTGWDVMVITNGPTLSKMMQLDYLTPLPADQHPNFDRYASKDVTDPAYDPDNRFTMAWQSGITGIAYDPKLTGRPVRAIADLFSGAFNGGVGLFADTTDLPNFALLAIGVQPETSTVQDWRRAAEFLRKKRKEGIIRGFYTQGYINALTKGDIAVSMAWSGDIFQQNQSGASSGLQFVVPEEGALLWTDNMVIPRGAQHPVDAIRLMDFVYRPEVAAMIASAVAYITPVPAARNRIQAMASRATGDRATVLAEVAHSPLVFPAPEDRAKLHTYRVLASEEETTEWDRLFAPFIGT
jgi:spermidine/putrescine transport system substrate-binding protein